MIREAFDDLQEGIIIGGKLIKEIYFAIDKESFGQQAIKITKTNIKLKFSCRSVWHENKYKEN